MDTPMRWRNAVRPNPCLDCPDRQPRCHTECAKYITWKTEVAAASKDIESKRAKDKLLDDHTINTVSKTKKH